MKGIGTDSRFPWLISGFYKAMLHWVDLQAERKKGTKKSEILRVRQILLLSVDALEKELEKVLFGIAPGSLADYKTHITTKAEGGGWTVTLAPRPYNPVLENLHALIAATYELGSLCPGLDRTTALTAPAIGKRKTLKQKRREIVAVSLAKAEAAYPDAGSYALAKNIKDEVNLQLGKHAVKEDTIRTDIDAIFKARKGYRQDVRS
jgi:hypothetical protein